MARAKRATLVCVVFSLSAAFLGAQEIQTGTAPNGLVIARSGAFSSPTAACSLLAAKTRRALAFAEFYTPSWHFFLAPSMRTPVPSTSARRFRS